MNDFSYKIFLRSTTTTTFYRSEGIIITYPLILEPTYTFEKKLEERGDYKRRYEVLRKTLEQNNNKIREAWSNMLGEFLNTVTDQPRIKQLLTTRSQKSLDGLAQEMTKIVKENDVVNKHVKGNVLALSRYMHEAQILLKLKEYGELSTKAEQNCALLNSSLKLPDNKEQLCSAIATLAKHAVFSIEAVCLDCWYEHKEYPFTLEMSRVTQIDLPNSCQTCSGKGIIYKISCEFPPGVNSLFLEDSSWIYEVFIGYAISNYNFIKKVYVHKKIQTYEDGKIKSGIEADVVVITNDDKLVIVEVTKQHDISNIHNNIERKIKSLNDFKIPYDKLIYVTASDQNNFFDFSNNNTRVFSLKHLTNLEYFIRDFVVDDDRKINKINNASNSR